MSQRYAIYFAPAADHPLWRLGSAVIGYDARSGADLARPDALPWSADQGRKWTDEPRRYGFHATLSRELESEA